MYGKSPTKNMVFDAKVMTLSVPEKKHGLMLGHSKKTYSYMKIKRQLETQTKIGHDTISSGGRTVNFQRQTKIQGVPISQEIDTTPLFYKNLDKRDPAFTINSKTQKMLPNTRFGKTYDYVNLKRLRDDYVHPGTTSTQVDEKTLKKSHKKATEDVLFSVQGIEKGPSFRKKKNLQARKPYNMPSKAYLRKMWDMMPSLQENRAMQGCGLIGYCPNQYCRNFKKIEMYPLGFGQFNFPDLHTLTICELCPMKAMSPNPIVLLGLWFKDCKYMVSKNPQKYDFLRIEEIRSIFPDDIDTERRVRGIDQIPIGNSIFGVGIIDGIKPSKSKLVRMKKKGVINDFKKGEGLMLSCGKLNSYDYEDKEIEWDARDKRYVDKLNDKKYRYRVV